MNGCLSETEFNEIYPNFWDMPISILNSDGTFTPTGYTQRNSLELLKILFCLKLGDKMEHKQGL